MHLLESPVHNGLSGGCSLGPPELQTTITRQGIAEKPVNDVPDPGRLPGVEKGIDGFPHPLFGLDPIQPAQHGIDVQYRALPVEDEPAITAAGQDFGVESKSVHGIYEKNLEI
jgi:hypothetical protein